MRCILCHRPLTAAAFEMPTRSGLSAWGPKCAKKAGLTLPATRKPARVKVVRDERQADWVAEVTACLQ